MDFVKKTTKKIDTEEKTKRFSPFNLVAGSLFIVLFLVLFAFQMMEYSFADTITFQIISVIVLGMGIWCLLPRFSSKLKAKNNSKGLTKRTLLSMAFILVAVPITVLVGALYLGDKKYYLISLLIILETIIPFFAMLEGKKPDARELVIISVLCALTVCGRVVFSAVPQFKPMLALIIISGLCFGGETGFFVGAVSAFVSNFFFGQGPWTPWQMFIMGIVGFVAGVVFDKGILPKTRVAICIFGVASTILIYGVIMNVASVLMMQLPFTLESVLTSCTLGFPLDAVHGASTGFFLFFIAEPMIRKIERIKLKFGL